MEIMSEAVPAVSSERVVPSTAAVRVAIVHDYLSERGGAERVAIALAEAFPEAPIHTSVYDPTRYPELAARDVRPSMLDRITPLRTWYRFGLPLMPLAFGRLDVDADVVVCSSSGWAHGATTDAPKIVYCHNPARWLYQREDYVQQRRRYYLAAATFSPMLRLWDRRAAASCEVYLANSTAVAQRINLVYGRDAEVVPPPVTLDPGGPKAPIEGVEPGFVVAVGRLLGYKNVAAIIEAFKLIPERRLVVIGDGPQRGALESDAPSNVTIVGRVSDEQLRWAYANCVALVSASHEDFGLTPVEAALFGKPSVLLRAGGFLDTTVENETGLFFDEATPWQIAAAVRRTVRERWSAAGLQAHGHQYSIAGFTVRMRQIVAETARLGP